MEGANGEEASRFCSEFGRRIVGSCRFSSEHIHRYSRFHEYSRGIERDLCLTVRVLRLENERKM